MSLFAGEVLCNICIDGCRLIKLRIVRAQWQGFTCFNKKIYERLLSEEKHVRDVPPAARTLLETATALSLMSMDCILIHLASSSTQFDSSKRIFAGVP